MISYYYYFIIDSITKSFFQVLSTSLFEIHSNFEINYPRDWCDVFSFPKYNKLYYFILV